jgi:hypothetical protein
MGVRRGFKIMTTALATAMVALSLSVAGASVCLRGVAPDCCREGAPFPASPVPAGATVLQASACDCCVSVDGLPYDTGRGLKRHAIGPAIVVTGAFDVALPSRLALALAGAAREAPRDTRPIDSGSVILLI